jgi:hypothetical protein
MNPDIWDEESKGCPIASQLPSILRSFHIRDGGMDACSGHWDQLGLAGMGTSTRLGMTLLRDLGQSYMGKMGLSFQKHSYPNSNLQDLFLLWIRSLKRNQTGNNFPNLYEYYPHTQMKSQQNEIFD